MHRENSLLVARKMNNIGNIYFFLKTCNAYFKKYTTEVKTFFQLLYIFLIDVQLLKLSSDNLLKVSIYSITSNQVIYVSIHYILIPMLYQKCTLERPGKFD